MHSARWKKGWKSNNMKCSGVLRSGYTRFRGSQGYLDWYDTLRITGCLTNLVMYVEYAWYIQSKTTKLNISENLMDAWTSSRSDKIIGYYKIGTWQVVLATGPGNLPAVWCWITKMHPFGSRPIQRSVPLHLGRRNTDPYRSTRRFRRVWLDPFVPISGAAFWVSLFIVAFWYASGDRYIVTLVHHCVFSMY